MPAADKVLCQEKGWSFRDERRGSHHSLEHVIMNRKTDGGQVSQESENKEGAVRVLEVRVSKTNTKCLSPVEILFFSRCGYMSPQEPN